MLANLPFQQVHMMHAFATSLQLATCTLLCATYLTCSVANTLPAAALIRTDCYDAKLCFLHAAVVCAPLLTDNTLHSTAP